MSIRLTIVIAAQRGVVSVPGDVRPGVAIFDLAGPNLQERKIKIQINEL